MDGGAITNQYRSFIYALVPYKKKSNYICIVSGVQLYVKFILIECRQTKTNKN